MKVYGIIPSRFGSSRFPGKPLAILAGKPLVAWVVEAVKKAKGLDEVLVATDDERIVQAVEEHGGKAVMTPSELPSGTDRIACAARNFLGRDFDDDDILVNIQGDEPFVQPSQLETIMKCFDDESTDIATLVKPFDPRRPYAELANPNSPKVVVDNKWNALYFSRSVVPYLRNTEPADWPLRHQYYTHLGMYAYRARVLQAITALPQSSLELAESLEQLRWIENGYRIKVGVSDIETIGIDTPQDLARAEEHLRKACNQK